MGGEGLDAQLEPLAQALILIIVLIGIAAISFFIINKVALRRKEKAHNKLSTSRRSKHAWVDLSGGSGASESTEHSKHRKRRRSSSNHVMLDILAKPKETKDGAPAPDEEPN
jgi:ABC-type microcin C transport system permease subunit YejB